MPKAVNYSPSKMEVTSFAKTLSATLELSQVYIPEMEVQKSQIKGIINEANSVMGQMTTSIQRGSFCLIQHVEAQDHPRSSSQCFPIMNIPDHLQKRLLSHPGSLIHVKEWFKFALCQRWTNVIKNVYEKNEVELGCWKNKLGEPIPL